MYKQNYVVRTMFIYSTICDIKIVIFVMNFYLRLPPSPPFPPPNPPPPPPPPPFDPPAPPPKVTKLSPTTGRNG